MQKVPSAFTFFAIANKVTYQFEIHIKKRSAQKKRIRIHLSKIDIRYIFHISSLLHLFSKLTCYF